VQKKSRGDTEIEAMKKKATLLRTAKKKRGWKRESINSNPERATVGEKRGKYQRVRKRASKQNL